MMEVIERLFRPPGSSYFLFGPRGVGKSLLARSLYRDALWVDLLDPETFRSYSARPERLRSLVAGNPGARDIVIDLRPLQAFKEDYPECTPILVHRGAERFKEGKVLCLPCNEFLRRIHPGRRTLAPSAV